MKSSSCINKKATLENRIKRTVKTPVLFHFHRHTKILGTHLFLKKILNKKKVIITTWLVCGVLYGMYYLLFTSPFFHVKHIQIQGFGEYINDKDITQVAEAALKDKDLYSIKLIEVKKNLLSTFQGVKDLKIRRKLPDTIIIDLQPRTAVIICVSADNKKYLIDADGYVMGETDEQNQKYPKVYYGQSILVGKFMETNVIPVSIDIINNVEKNNLMVSSISISNNYSKLYVNDGIEVYLSLSKSIKESIEKLSVVVRSTALDNARLKRVDLRYGKVIVSYE